jgi:peptidoglycan L-alanyl-D-glutamate endopeptidase CwlK
MTRNQKLGLFGGVAVLLYLASRSSTVRSAARKGIEAARKLAFGAGDPTEKNIATLASTMQPIVRKFVEQARAAGYRVVIASGTRTMGEQAALYAKGRTAGGAKVTNAPPGESAHNFGLAVDFAFGNAIGQPTWPEGAPWAAVAAIGKRLGLEWGGDWKGGFVDRPHLELPVWRNVRTAWKASGKSSYAIA